MNKTTTLRRNFFFGAIVVLATCASSVVAQCPKPGLVPLKTIINSGYTYTGAAIDLNGDAKPDLVTYQEPNKTKISLGMGGGAFATGVDYSTGSASYAPDFGDLNADGKPDMLVHNITEQTLDIWMNNGAGGFTFANSFSNPGRILAVTDLNGDGKGDMLISISHSVILRFGNGAGVFTDPVSYFTELNEFHMEGAIPGDFNGDGKMDVAANLVARPGGLPQVALRLYLNDGAGTMISDAVVSMNSVELKAAADLNGDGKTDLVGVTPMASAVTFVLNRGNGTFTPQSYTVRSRLKTASITDFDGDGKLDVLAIYDGLAAYHQGRTILFGDGLGGVSSQGHVSKSSFGFVQADFNGDGKLDYLDNGQNAWTHDSVVKIWQSTCNAPGDPRRIDFDGEGWTDKSVFRPANGTWYRPNPNGGAPLSFQFGASGDVATPGDYDGDGVTDMAVFRPSAGDWYVFNSATQTVTGMHFGSSGDRAVPADYDGDNRTDFAVYRPSSGVWYMFYSGDSSVHGVAFGISSDIAIPADFDGDGKADVAVYRGSEGMWYMIQSASNSFYAQPWGLSNDIPVPADYDSDGKADITVFRPSTGLWFMLRSYNSAVLVAQLGQSGDIPLAGFHGGNNTFEAPTAAVPATYRPSNGSFYVDFTNGTVTQVGAAGDVPVSTVFPVQ